jgi:hypothetical protein
MPGARSAGGAAEKGAAAKPCRATLVRSMVVEHAFKGFGVEETLAPCLAFLQPALNRRTRDTGHLRHLAFSFDRLNLVPQCLLERIRQPHHPVDDGEQIEDPWLDSGVAKPASARSTQDRAGLTVESCRPECSAICCIL